MKLKHRVVVMRQLSNNREERETVGPWVSPAQAELLSDKAAQDLEDDPVHYVLIEGNKPERAEKCDWSPIRGTESPDRDDLDLELGGYEG